MIVLDTNVVSEAMKPEPHPAVKTWLNDQVAETLYLSSVTLAEMMYGIGALPEGRRKRGLGMVFDGIVALFGERVLAFDADAAHHYAALAIKARAAGKACQWRTVILPPSPPPGIRRRYPRRRALPGSGHCRHQSLGRVLASLTGPIS